MEILSLCMHQMQQIQTEKALPSVIESLHKRGTFTNVSDMIANGKVKNHTHQLKSLKKQNAQKYIYIH